MSVCRIEEKDEGRSYPRTCPTCGLRGACAKGLDRESLKARIAALEAERDKMREALKPFARIASEPAVKNARKSRKSSIHAVLPVAFFDAARAALAETEGEWAWVKGVHTTTDDDGGRREGVRRKLHAWRANGFTIIQQDSPDGLFILRHPSGDASAWPSLEQAKQAALAETEGRGDE